MKEIKIKKALVVVIIMFFVGASAIPSTISIVNEKQSSININNALTNIGSRGTLYVGGSGPNNYTSIQDAIDDANSGDTVFVYSGIYYEHVTIDKSNIDLIGEDKATTIIDAGGYETSINIPVYSDDNLVSGLTIRNASYAIIYLNAVTTADDGTCNYNTISDCIVHDCIGLSFQAGIKIYSKFIGHADYNTVINCIFYDTSNGIVIETGSSSSYTSNNEIFNCEFYDNENGINLIGNGYLEDNTIINCTAYDNSDTGIYAQNCDLENTIYHNNLFNNDQNAYDDDTGIQWYNADLGEGNYYDDYPGEDSDGDGIGDTPYEIAGESNQDEYPMMNPWGENPPVARFEYVIDDLEVMFDGSASFDRDGEVISYEWDFGDGNDGEGMSVDHTYEEYGTYEITLTVTDNDDNEGNIVKTFELKGPNNPPGITTINGPNSGTPGETYSFTFVAEDPDGDDVYYKISWGDGDIEEWIGPYSSNEQITLDHSWAEERAYTIIARAKDVYDALGDWGTLDITIPKNKVFIFNFPLLNWLFERFPHIFPIFRDLLGLL